ncbi:MAG: MMPL family transporter, partial [Planctomycetes bacterium]|nr:MMPL family transporter [Planctomycetota bacterium]
QALTDSLEGVPEAIALAVVRDWHADVFKSESDPDPQTSVSTSLEARVRRRFEVAGLQARIPPELADRLESGGLSVRDWRLETSQVAGLEQPEQIITRVRTSADATIGHMLKSDDGKATLVMVELSTEFFGRNNAATVERIERLVIGEPEEMRTRPPELHEEMPAGLDVAVSGTATVGRDMRKAAAESARRIDWVTILLVLVLLAAIYRAPVLAVIPLLTVAVAVFVALRSLAMMADAGWLDLFSGSKVYVTVILYGAGVDYCMFLMARYKEELDNGATVEEAISISVERVGTALAASAGTTIVGIGMMCFAEFGKFKQAGLAMSLSLVFVLAAAVTFTPAVLRLVGRWAFWPNVRTERVSIGRGWLSPTSLVARLMQKDFSRGVWERVGRSLIERPGTIMLGSIAVMLPFAVIAILCFENRSYGLLTELPQDDPSVVGARALQEHFPPGQTGPITVLVDAVGLNFREPQGREAIETLAQRLMARKDELHIADIRSIADPLGMTATSQKKLAEMKITERAEARRRAQSYYVSDVGALDGHVTRLDVVFRDDPFTPEAMGNFERLRAAVRQELPEALQPFKDDFAGGPAGADAHLHYLGATPSIRDLKAVTGRDQQNVNALVLLGVLLVLVVLLKRVAVSVYLIVSVFFSYLVTLGVTFTVFWALDPAGFVGLDWKVPMFLFTILIAVGEDYNIYLVTRIEEEQLRHGPIGGITEALAKTGKIISSCGLIMAGTFSSLLAASLAGMQQLGFALAFGVLLDTFVVRPILVPAWLILLHSGRFGRFGKWLGAQEAPRRPRLAKETVEVGTDAA